jgi:membrane protease YdiL (CAAX protease family)
MKTMKIIKQLIALTIIVLIPFGLMIWFRSHNSSGFASVELIIYPLLFGGLSIGILYLLKRFYLKESLIDFSSGKGKWTTDILWGLALTTIYFILFYVERLTLSNILSFNSNMELLGLMLDMRKSPILLVIWFGPVLWIGIALYEELIRVFILSSLWKFSNKQVWSIVVIIISALIIGFAHWSQGSYGIVTIGIKSIVSGLYFYKYRRLFPLVIAHVLYDGIQVAMLLITYPH